MEALSVQLLQRLILAGAILCSCAWSDAIALDSERALSRSLRAELEKQAAEDSFSGAVLIAKDGRPLFQAAYGAADRERKVPNTVDTKFRFGSMGKMFTAVAIGQLVQAGKIGLQEPLGKYLPDYPNHDVAKVTIHQLLTHTGGTGDVFGPEFFERRTQLRELADYIDVFGGRGLKFPPGSRHEYSNYGYVLLGRVIEVVSGKKYDAFVRDNIFTPLGMSSTDNLPEDQHVEKLAIPYSHGNAPAPERKLHSAAESLPYRGTSAGGGYSTVGDLLKFANALMSNKLLDVQHTDLVTTGKVDAPRPGAKYAYGFEDEMTPSGARRIGHGGGAPGMNGILSIFPSSGYVIVVLANRDPPVAREIENFIGDRVFETGTRSRTADPDRRVSNR